MCPTGGHLASSNRGVKLARVSGSEDYEIAYSWRFSSIDQFFDLQARYLT